LHASQTPAQSLESQQKSAPDISMQALLAVPPLQQLSFKAQQRSGVVPSPRQSWLVGQQFSSPMHFPWQQA
jgi:hypothetical protein